MCGLCGEISWDGSADVGALQSMADSLRPRGPDAGGYYLQQQVGFGHRRLSIIDLAGASQQPMIDPHLGLGIVFNGCIYNYRDLRNELKAKGYRFFSEGDTEVILKAYHAWGLRCVEHFKGMFAFALWERDSGRVILARDRLGIKPLYWTSTGRSLRFASTLPALLAAGDVNTRIDPEGLHHYMSFHAVVPRDKTILAGVCRVPPATLMIVEPDGRFRQQRYWHVHFGAHQGDEQLEEPEWRAAVLEAMTTAVRRRLVSDVPVGVLLSGGLDSSLIVALLAQLGQANLNTFSIGFESVDDVKGDEFRYSDLVAKHFGTEHHRLHVDGGRAIEALPDVISAMSEPMMSHDAIGFYLLSEQVSQHIKVVQCGQGADEIFGGYHWYPPMMKMDAPLDEYSRLYFDRTHDEMKQALSAEYVQEDYSRDFVSAFFEDCSARAAIDKVLQIDTEIMLVDDPVKRVDNMTMAWGLEARVPFLDHEVVELAACIPADLKVRDGGKYILKQASRGIVPDAIIDRKKGYFPVPSLRYLRGPFLEYVRDILESPAARDRGIFNRGYVDRLLSDPEGELTPKGHSKLWQVAVLEAWLQSHGIH
ncbi:MAG: N-acetylglutaminylglutamine amidotransferase [Xanthobacteraceae bacterium]|nr:N-acetylglutaminylglutamine amidotransferase [Xanthobacteraceae bacterium]